MIHLYNALDHVKVVLNGLDSISTGLNIAPLLILLLLYASILSTNTVE